LVSHFEDFRERETGRKEGSKVGRKEGKKQASKQASKQARRKNLSTHPCLLPSSLLLVMIKDYLKPLATSRKITD
jgi:hypothetical protein